MAFIWFGLTLGLAICAWFFIRSRFGKRRVQRKLALPVLVAERTLADALDELSLDQSYNEKPAFSVPDFFEREFYEEQFFVSRFQPITDQFSRLSRAEVAVLGQEAALHARTLRHAIDSWNAIAGNVESAEALWPIAIAGFQAATRLSSQLGPEASQAKNAVDSRVLIGIVSHTKSCTMPQ